ncbi:MAG: pyruvate kinase [Gammaproteobacteria bacterium]|nr:pyruvate kinase [Gammaproteobacteria bacterium]
MGQSTNAADLIRQLDQITSYADALEQRFAASLERVHPDFQTSARNLIAYVAMRHVDIRDLQQQLAYLGLSSLGRAERNVRATIRAVRHALCIIANDATCESGQERVNFERSELRLQAHINAILGENAGDRDVRIMVTLPTAAADEYPLVHDLVDSGMDIARINCAHDEESVWLKMIENVRRAVRDTGRACKITMDLTGPKLRTGELKQRPGVVRVRPKRDATGRVIAPRRLRLIAEGALWSQKSGVAIPVPQHFIDDAEIGDRIAFKDTRGKKRTLKVVGKDERGLRLDCYKKAYIATGTKLTLHRQSAKPKGACKVGSLPPAASPIVMKIGDELAVHLDGRPGEPAEYGADGSVIASAHIACAQPEVFRSVTAGEPIRLNDGKIEGIVKSVTDGELIVTITRAKPTGSRLRGGRGINFPQSDMRLPGLTEADQANLEFAAAHADAVSLSFVREPADIFALQAALRRCGAGKTGIIIKIETETAFNDLPRLLLATMCHYPAAVMIARGDLAVECGWERLAEIQEEILWMCEAAEMPVIWATEVLEHQTKRGRPSRAEITDAAMAQRADCVMLNKGPYVLAAITMLDSILRRMQSHQRKKSPQLRKLSISEV